MSQLIQPDQKFPFASRFVSDVPAVDSDGSSLDPEDAVAVLLPAEADLVFDREALGKSSTAVGVAVLVEILLDTGLVRDEIDDVVDELMPVVAVWGPIMVVLQR